MPHRRLAILGRENGTTRLLQDDLERNHVSVACLFSEQDADGLYAFAPDALLVDQNSLQDYPSQLFQNISYLRPNLPIILAKEFKPFEIPAEIADSSGRPLRIAAQIDKPYESGRLIGMLPKYVKTVHHETSDAAYIRALFTSERLIPNLTVEYQSKHSLVTGGIVGYEALSRLKTRRAINPETIFSSAVDMATEMEATLGVVRDCIRLALALNKKHRAVPISFNCSAVLLTQNQFVHALIELLGQCRHLPNALIMEVTEEERVAAITGISMACELLREHSLKISIDDYGTGLNNLDRIAAIPFTELKIDKAIFWSYCRGDIPMSVLGSIIDFCHAKSAKSVIEGIETPQHLEKAKLLGADYGQGYHWGHAIPPQYFVSDWLIEKDVRQKSLNSRDHNIANDA